MVGLVVGLVKLVFRCCFLFITGIVLMGATSAVLQYFPSLSVNSALAELDTTAPQELISNLRQSLQDTLKSSKSANAQDLIGQAQSALNSAFGQKNHSKRKH